MSLNILYENATLQVVDKPAGVSMEKLGRVGENGFSPTPTLAKDGLKPFSLTPAHRLDKDTSGVLLVAKTKETLDYLQAQFQERKVQKTYLCLVQGTMQKEQGEITTLLGRSPNDRRKQKVFLPGEPGAEGKREASTEWRAIQRYQGYTFLEVRPKTGRKHQIRAHLSYLDHPIAGDKLYGFKNQGIPEGLNRQFLHASSIVFTLQNGEQINVESSLSEELQSVLSNLKTI